MMVPNKTILSQLVNQSLYQTQMLFLFYVPAAIKESKTEAIKIKLHPKLMLLFE